MCQETTTHVARHCYMKHFPWWLRPDTACWYCRVQEGSNSFLRLKHNKESCLNFTEHKERLKLIWVDRSYKLLEFIQTKLLFHTFEDMKKYVLDQKLYNQNSSEPGFSEEQCELLFQLSKSYNLDIPDTFNARPPNSIASMLHWEILINLMRILTQGVREEIISFQDEGIPTDNTVKAPTSFEFIDTHGHLDMLLTRTRQDALKDLENTTEIQESEVKLLGIVSNFVYPHHWKSYKAISKDERVKISFGIHPRMFVYHSQIKNYLQELETLLVLPNVVGIGEVGLGLTGTTPRQQKVQFSFLEQVLQLFRQPKHYNKVLILHCRDHNDGQAAKKVLDLIRKLELQHLKIHRHCFTGTSSEVVEWISALPNCYFGLTEAVFRTIETRTALTSIPLNRILLESDCPYLTPDPWNIMTVVHKLVPILNLPAEKIIENNNCNASQLYGSF